MSGSSIRRLRPSVHVAPVTDGLLFVGWQKSMVVHGSDSLGLLWDAVFPYLDRGVDTAQLLAALPETTRPAAQAILSQLDERGFLLPTSARATSDAGRDEHPEHRRTRAFLDAAADDPAAAYRRLRDLPIALEGEGPTARQVLRSLVRMGAGLLVVPDAAARRDVQGLATEHGCDIRESSAESAAVSVVVDTPERPLPGCRIDALVEAGFGLVGPVQSGPQDPGARLALERMARKGGETSRGLPADMPAVVARLVGGLAALRAVQHLCGITTELDGMVQVVEPERLSTSTHPLWSVRTPTHRPLSEAPEVTPAPEALDEVADSRTGLVAAPLPGTLPQVPLALVSAPLTDHSQVVGWAGSGDLARHRATLESVRATVPAPGQWWTTDGREAVAPVPEVSAAGTTVQEFLRHGFTRLVAGFLADREDHDRRLGAATETPVADLATPGSTPGSDELLAGVARWTDQGWDITGLRRATRRVGPPTSAVHVVALIDADDRTRSVTADTDETRATLAAVDHAFAARVSDRTDELVPQLSVPAWASEDDLPSTRARWHDALRAVCLPGEEPVAALWTAETVLDRIGLAGRVGLAAPTGVGATA